MNIILLEQTVPLVLFVLSLGLAILCPQLKKGTALCALLCGATCIAAVLSALICSVPLSEIFTCLLILLCGFLLSSRLHGANK